MIEPVAASRESLLDLLRFTAALMVLVFHLGFCSWSGTGYTVVSFQEIAWFAKYGYIGAECFFIISGYVISMSIANSPLKRFVSRRFIRLFPSYWLCLLMTLLVVAIADANAFSITWWAVFLNLPMIAPWFDAQTVDGSYWSLTVELEFYLVIISGMMIVSHQRMIGWLLAWVGVGSGMPLISHAVGSTVMFPGGGFVGYFGLGAAVWYLSDPRGSPKWSRILLLVSCASVCGHSYLKTFSVGARYSTYIDPYVVIVALTLFTLLVAFGRKWQIGGRLPRLFRLLGGLTYPLYLLHQTIGYVLINYLSRWNDRFAALCWATIIVIGLAFLVYRYYDLPVRRWLLSLRPAQERETAVC